MEERIYFPEYKADIGPSRVETNQRNFRIKLRGIFKEKPESLAWYEYAKFNPSIKAFNTYGIQYRERRIQIMFEGEHNHPTLTGTPALSMILGSVQPLVPRLIDQIYEQVWKGNDEVNEIRGRVLQSVYNDLLENLSW